MTPNPIRSMTPPQYDDRSALYGAEGQSPHDVSPEHQEDEHRWEHRDDGGRRDVVPGGAARRDVAHRPNGECRGGLVAEHQREDRIVPAKDEDKHRGDD